MSATASLIENAFSLLSQRTGYVERPDQVQLSLLINDLIESGERGAFEAPTGLGKSLACLLPALAHAILHQKRVVVATYTNVLAEQYWKTDLPLAISIIEELGFTAPKTQLLMGRQRYVCLAALEEHMTSSEDYFRQNAVLGNETEFRNLLKIPQRQLNQLWQKVVTPPVCPGRLCPAYDDCYYYKARKSAEKAGLVITNHSVVIQDALMARAADSDEGLLGKFDFLVLDEAHDFPSAASNGLEFELSVPRLGALLNIGARLESSLLPLAQRCSDGPAWLKICTEFKDNVEECQRMLVSYGLSLPRAGILNASPAELLDHPHVKAAKTPGNNAEARAIAKAITDACEKLALEMSERTAQWRLAEPDRTQSALEGARNYSNYLREFGAGSMEVFNPHGISVSYAGKNFNDTVLRQDIIGLAEPLQELIWNRVPYVCLSATLAIDGNFEFFTRTTGAEPTFQEILPSPYDYSTQAALYLPPLETLLDPTVARKEGFEDAYHRRVAQEISQIMRVCDGRTLALFHSRKEMEAVFAYMEPNPDLPVLMQMKQGASTTGDMFLKNKHSSLFALRSFWTGFDAPGETLSCVVLVRVPFEVPVDPPAIARLAHLQQQGLDAFGQHTLPVAKMMMRQGAGRLIRRAEDRGVIAILDPRVQTKRYGEEILANLPNDIRMFREIDEAAAWVGLQSRSLI